MTPSPTMRARLAADEERTLARQWRATEDPAALGRLVHAHTGLVFNIVKQFRKPGAPTDDLVQEGHVGLVIAAQRFDPDRGTRLSTYAAYWIRAYVMQHILRSHGAVRIGTTRDERKLFFNLARTRRGLERNGELASDAELAAALNVDEEEVARIGPRLSGQDRSLDQPRGEGREPLTLAANGPSPEELLADGQERRARQRRLSEALKRLDQRERLIVRARYLRERPMTLAVLGCRLRLSSERVRQLESRALAKLRRSVAPTDLVGPQCP